MRVHHLNCATMCPRFGGSWISGRDGEAPELVAHVLLLETKAGLVLVDTGFGLEDCAAPRKRLGASATLIGPRFDPSETALRRVEAHGFRGSDVKHIIVTHLDLDHAGGLPDFPGATVHVMAAEHDAAMQRRTLFEKSRYRPWHWRHGPTWKLHDVSGETWHGFESVRAIDQLGEEILLVPMIGHTRGHAAIAVNADRGWLLHAGDAYFHPREMRDEVAPPILEQFQRLIATDDRIRRKNRHRLRDLVRTADDVTVFCAHSKEELENFRDLSTKRGAA